MTLSRSKKRASTKPAKPEVIELKQAYLIPAEDGDKMINTLSELPIKYSHLIGPMLQKLQNSFRGDFKVNVMPQENPPVPILKNPPKKQ